MVRVGGYVCDNNRNHINVLHTIDMTTERKDTDLCHINLYLATVTQTCTHTDENTVTTMLWDLSAPGKKEKAGVLAISTGPPDKTIHFCDIRYVSWKNHCTANLKERSVKPEMGG